MILAVNCPTPPHVLHGYRTSGDTYYGSVIGYGCDLGHSLTSGLKNFSIECLADGNWSWMNTSDACQRK